MGSCVLGIALVGIGVVVSATAAALGVLWYRARNWPAVNGVITESEILTRRNPIGAGVVAEEYRPLLVYEYEAYGRKYVGNKLKFYEGRLWTRKRSLAEGYLLDPGERVRVRISPKNAQRSVLDPSVGRRELDLLAVIFITGALVGGVGYWVALVACEGAPGLSLPSFRI